VVVSQNFKMRDIVLNVIGTYLARRKCSPQSETDDLREAQVLSNDTAVKPTLIEQSRSCKKAESQISKEYVRQNSHFRIFQQDFVDFQGLAHHHCLKTLHPFEKVKPPTLK
jgi:hypothetical protein